MIVKVSVSKQDEYERVGRLIREMAGESRLEEEEPDSPGDRAGQGVSPDRELTQFNRTNNQSLPAGILASSEMK